MNALKVNIQKATGKFLEASYRLGEKLLDKDVNTKEENDFLTKLDELTLAMEEMAASEEKVDGKCTNCNGTGMVQVAPNSRGIKTCPVCGGKRKQS